MAEVKQIPLRLVTPHPKLSTRLKLEVRSLAALLADAVDEDVPNGQLEPGRVVPRKDGEGYYVYIGVRRFFALKSLYEETGDKRFDAFNAYVDSEKSLLSLFLRVRSENEEGRGERVGLSVLEKIFGLHRISGLFSPERLDEGLKRELAIAEKLDENRIMKLFEVERAAHFGYRLEHLERLCEIEDPEELFESAACTAGFAFPPERMEKAVEGRDAAHMLKWFGSLFPEYAKGREVPRSDERKSSGGLVAGTDSEKAVEIGATANAPCRGALEVHEREVIIVPCPACAVENMVQVRMEAEVTRLSGDARGESITASADVVVSCGVRCYHCPSEFHVFIRPLGGRRYAVEASLSAGFRDPSEILEAVDLRFDFEKEVWQKLAGEKIVGVVRASGGSRK
jgi:hypothetical protein